MLNLNRYLFRNLAFLLIFLNGCLQNPNQEIFDPLESINRKSCAFNVGLYNKVLKPSFTCYEKITSNHSRRAVHNFMGFLQMPLSCVFNFLRLQPKKALDNLSAFMLNGIFGLGFMDVAQSMGIKHKTIFIEKFMRKYKTMFVILPCMGIYSLWELLVMVGYFFVHPTVYVMYNLMGFTYFPVLFLTANSVDAYNSLYGYSKAINIVKNQPDLYKATKYFYLKHILRNSRYD